jgi:hypothetical protein
MKVLSLDRVGKHPLRPVSGLIGGALIERRLDFHVERHVTAFPLLQTLCFSRLAVRSVVATMLENPCTSTVLSTSQIAKTRVARRVC